jgi:hypothetical protein
MRVHGIGRLTLRDLIDEVRQGGRFVVFSWCVGMGITTLGSESAVHFLRARARAGAVWKHLRYTLPTALLGWWALPKGPARAIACLRENLAGGRDVTAHVLRMLARGDASALAPAPPPPRPRVSPTSIVSEWSCQSS